MTCREAPRDGARWPEPVAWPDGTERAPTGHRLPDRLRIRRCRGNVPRSHALDLPDRPDRRHQPRGPEVRGSGWSVRAPRDPPLSPRGGPRRRRRPGGRHRATADRDSRRSGRRARRPGQRPAAAGRRSRSAGRSRRASSPTGISGDRSSARPSTVATSSRRPPLTWRPATRRLPMSGRSSRSLRWSGCRRRGCGPARASSRPR